MKRRVSTRIAKVLNPRGTARVWTGFGGAHGAVSGRFLPDRPLTFVGRLSIKQARAYVQRKARLPRLAPMRSLVRDERSGQWWLITDF